MAKNKKDQAEADQIWLHRLPIRRQHQIAIGIIFVFSLLYFYPMVFQGKSPPKSDISAWKGASHSIVEYNQTHSDRALWATDIFSGMPAITISVPSTVPGFQEFVQLIDPVIDWEALYMFIFGVVFYFLLRFWGISMLPAVLGTLAFLMLPNHLGILEAGHNAKYQAMLMVPAVVYAFHYFVKNTSLWSFLLLALVFFLEGRIGHYQIIFYIALIMLAIGIPYLYQYVREKQWKRMALQLATLIAAIGIGLAMIAPKVVLTKDFLPHSTRGGSGEEVAGKKSDTGVGLDYAMQWSFHPAEALTFLIPNYFGGSSSMRYEGDAVPQLQGRQIPGYWGHMPFTSTTKYIGVMTIMLAILGIIRFRKHRLILSLGILCVLAFLLAMGRHFELFYKLWYNYVPLFNKFRVPSMSLFILFFSFPVFAAFGIQSLLDKFDSRAEQYLKYTLGVGVVFVGIGLISIFLGESIGFIKGGELNQYNSQVIDLLKRARMDLMHGDAWRLVIFTLLGVGLLYAYLKEYLSKGWMILGIIALVLVDMYTVDHRYMDGFNRPESRVEQPFSKTAVDQYLRQDQDRFRIFPLGNLWQDNRWAYYHQTIGGYRPAKMRRYQDILDNSLYQGWNQSFPVNWNVVRMLNVKYLIAQQQLPGQAPLSLAFKDDRQKQFVYEYSNWLPRALFVDSIEVIPEKRRQIQRLNQRGFNPAESAILAEMPDTRLGSDSGATAEVISYGPNRIEIETTTPETALLVLSEIHLEDWWKVRIDGENVPVHRANYLLRSVVVPPGSHTVEFYIHIPVFTASVWGARIIALLLYGALLWLITVRFGVPQRIQGLFRNSVSE